MNYEKYKTFLDGENLTDFETEFSDFKSDQNNLTELYTMLKNGDVSVLETINEYLQFQKERIDKLYQFAQIAYKKYQSLESKIVKLEYEIQKKKKLNFKTEKMKQVIEKEIEDLQDEMAKTQALMMYKLDAPVWRYEFHDFIPMVHDNPYERIAHLERENLRLKTENYMWRKKKYNHLILSDDVLENKKKYSWQELKPAFEYLKLRKKNNKLNEEQNRKYLILKALSYHYEK